MKRTLPIWPMISLIALGLLLPIYPALAADPFALQGVAADSLQSVGGTAASLSLQDGALLPRNATGLHLTFNQDLGADTAKVTVVDSKGADAGWAISSHGNVLDLTPARELPRNETYTITLPAGLTLTLHTDGQAYPITTTIKTGRALYGVDQYEYYGFKVEPGPLTVNLDGVISTDRVLHLNILNWQTGATLVDGQFPPGGATSIKANVPAAATYDLRLARNLLETVTLSGMDLDVLAPEAAALQVPSLSRYQWITQPLTVNMGVINPLQTKELDIHLLKGDVDPALASLNAGTVPVLQWNPSADQATRPLTIDPTRLDDGVYTLVGTAFAGQDYDTMSWFWRTLVIDKAPVFGDVPATQWARRWVDALSYLGVVNGRGAGLFAPGDQVKRSEFAKMLALAHGLKPATTGNDFADVPDDWSRPYIEALYQAKLITGDVVNGQRYFYPNQSISRAEAATIIGRAEGIADGAFTGAIDLTDFAQVPTYAQNAVAALTQKQMLTGFPDKTFRPLQTLQRDQAAKILGSLIGITQ